MRRCSVIVLGGLLGCSAPGPVPAEYAAGQERPAEFDPDARVNAKKALAVLREGDVDGALQKVAGLDPGSPFTRAVHGRCLAAKAQQSNPPDLALMERAEGEILVARRWGEDVLVLQLHAEFLELDGQVTLAAAVLDELLALDAKHVEGLRAAARLRFELGQERQAVDLLRRLLELAPDDAEATYRFAHCRVSLAEAIARGDSSEVRIEADAARKAFLLAAETWRRYQSLRPEDGDGYLGEAHARIGAARSTPKVSAADATKERRDTLPVLAVAAEKAPRSPAPHHGRGVVFEDLGESTKARTEYEAALAKDPQHLPSLLNLARLLDAAGDPKAARALCLRALTLDVTPSERDRLLDYIRK